MEDGPSWLTVAATVALDMGLAAMLGALASSLWLRDARSAWGAALAQRSRGTLLGAAGFTALALVALLCVQTAAMADVPLVEIAGELGPVLGSTQIGHAWLMAAPCLLVALIAAAVGLKRASRPMAAVAWLATLGFVGCRAAASHAAVHGPVSLAVAVEAIHLVLIALWIGMVLVAATKLDGSGIEGETQARADVARWIDRLSSTATLVLVGIVLTGIFNAWRGMGAVSDLSTTGWGRLLVLKLVFVAAAVLLGGLNRLVTMPVLLPALASDDGPIDAPLARFVRVARIEALVLVAALVVAALLAASAPAVAG